MSTTTVNRWLAHPAAKPILWTLLTLPLVSLVSLVAGLLRRP